MAINTKLLKAVGPWNLGGYFEDLDDLRKSGECNMFGSSSWLRDQYPGMTNAEAKAVVVAWMETFSESLPVEDRVHKAMGDA